MPLDRDGLIVPLPSRSASPKDVRDHAVYVTSQVINAAAQRVAGEDDDVINDALMRNLAIGICGTDLSTPWLQRRRNALSNFGRALDEAQKLFARSNPANEEPSA